jgi:hypothetical protein
MLPDSSKLVSDKTRTVQAVFLTPWASMMIKLFLALILAFLSTFLPIRV